MIADWKTEHGELSLIKLVDKEDASKVYSCVVRKKIPKETFSQALKFITTDLGKATSILIKNTWLGGDEIILTDDALRLQAGGKVAEQMSTAEAEVENL
jgi:hypothetical protein